jgi:hypothetical protein
MKPFPAYFPAASLLAAASISLAEDVIDRKPLAIGTKIETGQIVSGEPDYTSNDPDKFYLSQIGVNLTQEVTVNQRLEMKVGVGGVFYYSFPIIRGQAGSQGTKFGPGVSQAQALYKFGDPESPAAALRVGYFPFKYNPDARNLGEYLFRSMPYPTFVFTGGWSITDNAFIRAQGVQFTLNQFDGALRHDFLITSERDFRPQGDFTPAYLAEANVGPFQFGAGVALFHFLPIEEKRVMPKDMTELSILRFRNLPAFTAVTNYRTGQPDADGPVVHPGGAIEMTVNDWNNLLLEAESGPVFSSDPAQNAAILESVRAQPLDTVTIDMRGIKLMGRASFNPGSLMQAEFLGRDAFKIYAEAALLGTRNQPGFFENRNERMPFMAGINLPTFRLLDALNLEVEYFPSSLPDNFDQLFDNNYPTYNDYSLLFHNTRRNRQDDWKWSLYAAKSIATGFSVRAQVANDHFRTITILNNFTGQSIMREPKNWYYVVTLNFGI